MEDAVIDFDKLRRESGSFVGSAGDFEEYRRWAAAQVCEVCGRGKAEAKGEAWITETRCGRHGLDSGEGLKGERVGI
jgi:hypothetical protein